MPPIITTDIIKERLYNLVGDEYELVSDYERGSKKVDFLHKDCGKIFTTTPNHFFYDGRRCICHKYKAYAEKFEKEFSELHNGEYTQVDPYTRSNIKIRVKHNTCGNTFKMSPKDLMRGRGCPDCNSTKLKTTEEFSKEVTELSKGEYTLLSEYVNNKVKVIIQHDICGHQYKVTPKDYLRGNRCPLCKQSKGERIVRMVLDDMRITYEIEKVYDDLKVRGKFLPFDFYLPEHNILIEYDGVQHFKEVKYFGGKKKLESQVRRDNIKTDYAVKNGFILIRIPYTINSYEKIKEILCQYL